MWTGGSWPCISIPYVVVGHGSVPPCAAAETKAEVHHTLPQRRVDRQDNAHFPIADGGKSTFLHILLDRVTGVAVVCRLVVYAHALPIGGQVALIRPIRLPAQPHSVPNLDRHKDAGTRRVGRARRVIHGWTPFAQARTPGWVHLPRLQGADYVPAAQLIAVAPK